jgi:hypothetical protein
MKPQAAMETRMIEPVIFSLIYGPIAVTLGYWLFFAVEADRANKKAVVRILSHRQRPRRPAADRRASPHLKSAVRRISWLFRLQRRFLPTS